MTLVDAPKYGSMRELEEWASDRSETIRFLFSDEFTYIHLSGHQRQIAKACCDFARQIIGMFSDSPALENSLIQLAQVKDRLLLEAQTRRYKELMQA